MMTEQRSVAYRFGEFTLEPDLYLLRRGEQVVHLRPKSFSSLLYLIQNSNRLVTKDELLDAVWVDAEVTQGSVSQCILEIRHALDDQIDQPQFIETIPRLGYRFVNEVELITDSPRHKLVRPITARAVAATVLAIAVLVAWLLDAEAPRSPSTAVPLTTYPGSERSPSFSPDGNRVAFSWNGENEDNFDIYVNEIGTSGRTQLTDHPAQDFNPAWSPDGRSIAFLRRTSRTRAEVLLIPALGGPEVKLADLTFPQRLGFAWKLAWSQDSNSLAFGDSGPEPPGLFVLSIDSRQLLRLTSGRDFSPAFSLDSRTLAFSRGANFLSNVYVADLSEDLESVGSPRRLTAEENGDTLFPIWAEGGREIIYNHSESTDELRSLYRISLSGSDPAQQLAFGGEGGTEPAISVAASRMAYVRPSSDMSIWQVKIPADPESVASPKKYISSTLLDRNPEFSPNGSQIVLNSTREGSSEIWVCNSDGSEMRRLTSLSTARSIIPRWSPDGNTIVFHHWREGFSHLFTISKSGGAVQQLTAAQSRDRRPTLSGDGEWVYFDSDRSGQIEIWRMPLDEGEAKAEQLTKAGGQQPLESADGKMLYFLKRNLEGGLWSVPVDGGEERRAFDSSTLQSAFKVAENGVFFFSQLDEEEHVALMLLNSETQDVDLIARIEGVESLDLIGSIDISPDGEWLLYSKRESLQSDIMLIENFR
jgi:Tol biopolymer transport system component/DNA-binding winged helix-turn-helix (wHTH) protein